MLDKPFEAAFGYIHVLPGAFSGYRWKALKSVTYKEEEEKYHEGSESERYTYEPSMDSEEEEGETLMKRYLKTALSEKLDISLEDSNMYLAEDRIMCLGIHALGYTLDYLPDAESVVDPVTSLTRLLGQRRRWINGSWFAFNYVQEHSYESTSCLFYLQLLYYSFVKKVSWIQITIFYVAMNLTLISAVQSYVVPAVASFFLNNQNYQLYNYKLSLFNIGNVIDSIPDIINFLYIVLISGNLLYGVLVNNNNSRFKKLYYLSSTILGVYGLIVVTLLVVNTISIGL
jgi:chitin synthase